MTEITESIKSPFWPAPRPQTHLIDPVAFGVALICAPLLITAYTFWVFLIPVAALFFGGPLYLAIATPTLLWWLRSHEPRAADLAMLAAVAVIAFAVGAEIYLNAIRSRNEWEFTLFYGGFGLIFGPLWAAQFAPLYRRLRRAEFARHLS